MNLHLMYTDGTEKLYQQSRYMHKKFSIYNRKNKHTSWVKLESYTSNYERFAELYGNATLFGSDSIYGSGITLGSPGPSEPQRRRSADTTQLSQAWITATDIDVETGSITFRNGSQVAVRPRGAISTTPPPIAQHVAARHHNDNELARREDQREADLRRREEERSRPRNLWERARNLF